MSKRIRGQFALKSRATLHVSDHLIFHQGLARQPTRNSGQFAGVNLYKCLSLTRIPALEAPSRQLPAFAQEGRNLDIVFVIDDRRIR